MFLSLVLYRCRNAEQSEEGYHLPMCAHHPVLSACLYKSSSKGKEVDNADGEGEPSDRVREMEDIPVSFMMTKLNVSFSHIELNCYSINTNWTFSQVYICLYIYIYIYMLQ